MKTVQELAKELSDNLVGATRTDGAEYIHLKNGRPEWMQDVVRAAHDNGNILPDDYRYRFIEEAAQIIADSDDLEETDIEADVYTSSQTAWLNSRNDRVYYLTEALTNFGSFDDGFNLLMSAQYMEKSEVLNQLKDALQEVADNQDDSEAA